MHDIANIRTNGGTPQDTNSYFKLSMHQQQQHQQQQTRRLPSTNTTEVYAYADPQDDCLTSSPE